MHTLIRTGILLLVGLFAVGWLGSLVVVIISGVEDMRVVFSKDDVQHGPIEG